MDSFLNVLDLTEIASLIEFLQDELDERESSNLDDYVGAARRAVEIADLLPGLLAERDRVSAEVATLGVALGKERDQIARLQRESAAMREALDAAESILRYTPNISTNCNGTKPGMSTRHAHQLVCAALAQLDAPPPPPPPPAQPTKLQIMERAP